MNLTQPPTGGNSGRGGLTGSALVAIWFVTAINVVLAALIAWGLHSIIRPKHGATSAFTLGRKWAAWMVAVGSIVMLPPFFRKLDGDSFALWAIGVVGWGGFAFFIGWIIGLFKFRKKNTASISSSPPPLTETLAADTHENDWEMVPNGPGMGESIISQDAKNKEQRLPLILNNIRFEVEIPEGNNLGKGYVEILHHTQYSLILKNHPWVPCDAEVAIDGIQVGTWRIESRGEIRIERPVHDTGHFTFFEVGTEEACKAGITKNPDNRLISIIFKPEKEVAGLKTATIPPSISAGATGLTGESQQKFREASAIEHDMDHAFTIHMRLVSRKPDIRPLAPRSTPIPPPVD